MSLLDIHHALPATALQFRAISYSGLEPGPRLIVTAAVHGNETCGTRGILQTIAQIDAQQITIERGCVTFVPITNPLAFQKQERSGDRNLNRNLSPNPNPVDFEDRIGNWLCPLLAQHGFLLDLHSFHTGGRPFAMVGPKNNSGSLEPFTRADQEEAMALRLGVNRFVDGWLDTYARGTSRRAQLLKASGQTDRAHLLNTDSRYGVGTTEYMRSVGGCAITLECGQHQDASAPYVAYTAIQNTLAHLGLINAPAPAPVNAVGMQTETLSLFDVIDKVHDDDAFAKAWASFDPVKAGELIGTRQNGEKLIAQADGFVVFPNPKAQTGQEWFYLAKSSGRL